MSEKAALSHEAGRYSILNFTIKLNFGYEVRGCLSVHSVKSIKRMLRGFIVDFQNMRGFHFMALESQMRELTMMLCFSFACTIQSKFLSIHIQ